MSYWKNLETRRWCAVDMARRNLSGNRRPAWLIEYWFNNKSFCFYFHYRLSILEFLKILLSNACNPTKYRYGGNEHEVYIGFAKKMFFITHQFVFKEDLNWSKNNNQDLPTYIELVKKQCPNASITLFFPDSTDIYEGSQNLVHCIL